MSNVTRRAGSTLAAFAVGLVPLRKDGDVTPHPILIETAGTDEEGELTIIFAMVRNILKRFERPF